MIHIMGKVDGGLNLKRLNFRGLENSYVLGSKDYLITCGDFKIPYNKDLYEEGIIKFLETKPYTILVVEGSKENFNFIDNLPELDMFGGRVGKIGRNIFRLNRGYIYKIDNKKIFTLGGGYNNIYYFKVPNSNFWNKCVPSIYDLKRSINNLSKNKYKVDYIITSECPSSHKLNKYNIEDNRKYVKFLDLLLDKVDYKYWYYSCYESDEKFGNMISIYNKVYNLDKDNLIL